MKRAVLSVVAVLLTAAALHAQTIAGVWQGTLPAAASGKGSADGAGLRIVFTVDKKPDGSLRGVMGFIDRGNTIPLKSATLFGQNVTFAVSEDVNFHGKLSA